MTGVSAPGEDKVWTIVNIACRQTSKGARNEAKQGSAHSSEWTLLSAYQSDAGALHNHEDEDANEGGRQERVSDECVARARRSLAHAPPSFRSVLRG